MKNDYSHFYNKGVNGRPIFFVESDYLMLLDLMNKYCLRYHITMIAYCMIPNHYHFLLRQNNTATDSRFVQTLFNTFVQKMNRIYKRQGTLFKGSAKSCAVDKKEYLYHLCRYIHANPVKHNLVKDPLDWAYSNYHEYLHIRDGSLYDESFFNGIFDTPNEYKQWVDEYIESIMDVNAENKIINKRLYFE